ncbi:TPA: hypothetical protein K8N36_003211 [Clostridium perfringens]|uniref:hypothetical protein n=1 Tax=Clostridium perfringens TaxID=1502 RepID=UPI0013E287C1|nr:hypothetical protein [Clostridium perfringens]EJT6559995.1 hypothetical protein [Clostridium perfringens]NGT85733.1 hypothetical protein [Clostridium perfringens]HBI6902225.1 hypothetical protein [Clostridium perfringens]HBI6941365.1 hypothetical protein [Clostridium perfringens]
MKYKCIKSFFVDKVDDEGFWEEQSIEIKENSVWEADESNFRCIGADIRLIEDVEGYFNWLELPKERLENNFELIQ